MKNKIDFLHSLIYSITNPIMLYVGYPVSYTTARKLFSISEGGTVKEIEAVIAKTGLTLSWIDKNLCILGLTLDDVGKLGETFVSVDDALILILQKKKEVTKALKDAGVDLSELWIEKMEEEPELAFNPPPFLISA